MDVLATKTPGQREDEEAERLVRPLPKKKPPRHDRRRERMDVDRDPDVDGDDDIKSDPDLKLNRKNIGGSVSLARIVRKAKEADKVKVRRKEDGRVVEISKDTLRDRGGDFEKYQPGKWEQEADHFAEQIKNDPALGSRLRNLLNPKSDIGGLAEGNPTISAAPFEKNLPPNVRTLGDLRDVAKEVFSRPKPKKQKAKQPAQAQPKPSTPAAPAEAKPEPGKQDPKGLPALPPQVQKIIKDLVKVTTPKAAPGAPAAPGESPEAAPGEPEAAKAPPAKSKAKKEKAKVDWRAIDPMDPKYAQYSEFLTFLKETPKIAEYLAPLLDGQQDSELYQNISKNPEFPLNSGPLKTYGEVIEAGKALRGEIPIPKKEKPKKEKPEGGGEGKKPPSTPGEGAGEGKPKGKGKEPTPPPPPRRTPNKDELFEARRMVIDTFPPKLAAKYIALHPDDIHELVSNYNEFKGASKLSSDKLGEEFSKVKNWSLDPKSVPEPETVEVDGKQVKTSELSPEVRQEAIEKHRMQTIGARLAFRSQAISAYKEAGVPPKVAGQVTDFMLSTNGMKPEERLRKAQEKSRDIFVTASTPTFDADPEVESRYGVEAVPQKWQMTGRKERRSTVDNIKDPVAKLLAVASFQGEDYRTVVNKFLASNSSDRISEQDTQKSLERKLTNATQFLQAQSDDYPWEARSSLEDPRTVFLVQARHSIGKLKNSAKLRKVLDQTEVELYDAKKKAFDHHKERYEKDLDSWVEGGKKGDPPISVKEPRKPAAYSRLRPGRGDEAKGKMEGLLNPPEAKKAEEESPKAEGEKPKAEGEESKPDEESKPEKAEKKPEPEEEAEPKEQSDKESKKASYSSYPSDRWQMHDSKGSHKPQTSKVAIEQAEGAMTIKFAKEDANRTLTRLDAMAKHIQANHKTWGMPFDVAHKLVNGLDRTADEIEVAVFGPESLSARQVNVLKAAKVIQQESDEGYMATFNSPSSVHQQDADEGYMSQFKDDDTNGVNTGKSSTGRPLAP